MQIFIHLTQVEPPAGTLWLHSDPGPNGGIPRGERIDFTGWLGMTRALSELIGPPGDPGNT